jgi:hypothetical protein
MVCNYEIIIYSHCGKAISLCYIENIIFWVKTKNIQNMLRLLILLFTLNAIFLPTFGYADVSVQEVEVVTAHDNVKCQMLKTCPNCQTENMNCGTACSTHCFNHIAALPVFFSHPILPEQNCKISTIFPHFYVLIISPDQRPL